MDSWLKKWHDNGSEPTADYVEAAVKTNANRVFANVFTFYYLLPLNDYHKYTTHSACYFNREGSRKF